MLGSFDRLGYLRHRRRFVPGDLDVDLRGKVAIVTGANAGLGRATAAALAARGATLRLWCRDARRGAAARDELRASGNSRVELDVVDVSDLDAVRRAAAGIARVDLLIHNAGVLPDHRIASMQDHELTFATHVLGPHLLTRLLEPALRASADARVIFVSSGGMYPERLSLRDVAWRERRYDGVLAYAQTKRMQVVLAALWAERLAGGAVTVASMHPGWADTQSVRTSLPRFHALLRPVLRSPEEGADTIVWLAVRQPAPTPSGAFWFDRKARATHLVPWTRESAEDRAALWAACEALTAPPAPEGGAPGDAAP